MWIEIVSRVWDGESLLKPKPVKFSDPKLVLNPIKILKIYPKKILLYLKYPNPLVYLTTSKVEHVALTLN